MLISLNILFEQVNRLNTDTDPDRHRDRCSLYKSSEPKRWPALPSDVMPHLDQPMQSVHMLAAWSFIRHIAGAPLYTFARMFCEMIWHLRAWMVPGLLKTPLIWDWLADLVRCHSIEIKNNTIHGEAMFSLLSDAGRLLSFICNMLLDDELVMWATSDGQRSLERVLKFTSDGMEAVSAAII
jgi:hypothetical protein